VQRLDRTNKEYHTILLFNLTIVTTADVRYQICICRSLGAYYCYAVVVLQKMALATYYHGSVVDSKHFYLVSHIPLFCFSFLCVVLAVLTEAMLKKFSCNEMYCNVM